MAQPGHLTPDRWKRATEALWRWVADGVIVLGPRDDVPVTLAGGGAALWQVLEEPSQYDVACRRLAVEHGVPEDVISADLAPFFDELVERGILERA